jgi:hypothetical protein
VKKYKSNIIMAISNIERRSSWYDIIDERGKKVKTLASSIGEIKGFSSEFFIINRGAWYDLYDEDGKKFKTLSVSIGEILVVSGKTFIVKRGSWHDTYDMNGKKINTKYAN